MTRARLLRWLAALILMATAVFFLLLADRERAGAPASSGLASVTLAAALSEDFCIWPSESGPDPRAGTAPPLGGDLAPLRSVVDPYPTFNGIALDSANNRVIMSDENRKSVLTYDRARGSHSAAVTPPLRQIIGPHTEIGYISSVEPDPARHELFIANNDTEDRIIVFDYDAQGDLEPKRRLYVPHQTWGMALNPQRDELAISVQQLSILAIYRRQAAGLEAPLRIIKGPHTGMADPHGLRWDAAHHEIIVANHGNSSIITPYSAYDAGSASSAVSSGGHFNLPSLTVFQESAKGDAQPLRTIQGPHTQLNWPMGIEVDVVNNEIVVANNGDDSVLVFGRTTMGDVQPERVIRGPHTGISSPMGVAIDVQNDELWVANYGDHTALVFSRTATGDAAPKRIVRNAPAGTPTAGFGNPYAVSYDSKRDELLVPN